MTGKRHMLLKYCVLPEGKIDDIKLRINGDLTRYQEVKTTLHRMAKGPDREKQSDYYSEPVT